MKTTQLAWKSSAGPLTEEQPQQPTPSSFPLQNATSAVSSSPATPQIAHKRNPGPNSRTLQPTDVNSKPKRVPEDDVSEGSTDHHAKFAVPHSCYEGEVTKLELERQLSVLLAAQVERDQRIARLTGELALKGALLEQAEANAVEAAKRAGQELRKHVDDRCVMQTSLARQRDVEFVDMQARLRDMQVKLDKLLHFRDQQIEQCENEVTNVRAKLEAKESELEVVRSRLTDAEKGWIKSKAEADTLRAQTATGSVNTDEDQVIRRLFERVRAIEAEMASKRWNE